MRSFKFIQKLWPLLAIPVAYFNVDFGIIPFIRAMGWAKGFNLFLIATLLATAELEFWFRFWSWVGDLVKLGKETEGMGRIQRLWKKSAYIYDKILSGKITALIRRGGYPAAFLISIFVIQGGRLVGIIFYASLKSRMGFFVVMIGNIIHTAMMVLGWEIILKYLGF